MTGLLSANRIAVFKHVLEHIAVAYLCGFALDAVVFAKLEETHIAHHRDHGGILGELATPLHIERTDRNDLITVNKPALFIDHQQTVCVAIKGKADITALFHGIGLELLQVCRAAAVVNIHAIRLRADDVAFNKCKFVGRFVGDILGSFYEKSPSFITPYRIAYSIPKMAFAAFVIMILF